MQGCHLGIQGFLQHVGNHGALCRLPQPLCQHCIPVLGQLRWTNSTFSQRTARDGKLAPTCQVHPRVKQLAQGALQSHLLIADSTPPRPAEQVQRRDEAVLPRKHIAALQSHDDLSWPGFATRKHGFVNVTKGLAGAAQEHTLSKSSTTSTSGALRPSSTSALRVQASTPLARDRLCQTHPKRVRKHATGHPISHLSPPLQLAHCRHQLGRIAWCNAAALLQDCRQLAIWYVANMQLLWINHGGFRVDSDCHLATSKHIGSNITGVQLCQP